MHSIRRQLLVWLLALVIVGVGFAGWLIYRQALAEANELFDYQLEQIAAALPSEPFSSVLQSRSDSDEGVVIQIWNRNGVLMYYSHPPKPRRAAYGVSTAPLLAITSSSSRSRCPSATGWQQVSRGEPYGRSWCCCRCSAWRYGSSSDGV
jgi:hypothetical protein